MLLVIFQRNKNHILVLCLYNQNLFSFSFKLWLQEAIVIIISKSFIQHVCRAPAVNASLSMCLWKIREQEKLRALPLRSFPSSDLSREVHCLTLVKENKRCPLSGYAAALFEMANQSTFVCINLWITI